MREFFSKLFNIADNSLVDIILERSTYIIICIITLFIVQNMLKRVFNKILKKNAMFPSKQTVYSVLYSTLKYSVYFIVVLIILEILGFPTSTVIAAAGVGGIAIGLGAQSLISDVISGIFILFEAQFQLGDIIKVGNIEGIVESINLRITTLRDGVTGGVYIIPNSKIGIVENLSKDYAYAIIDFNLPYDEDVDKTLMLIRQSLSHYQNPYVIEAPDIIGITDFANNGLKVRISCKCEPHHKWQIEREIRYLIHKDLKTQGISLPNTTHTVTLKP